MKQIFSFFFLFLFLLLLSSCGNASSSQFSNALTSYTQEISSLGRTVNTRMRAS